MSTVKPEDIVARECILARYGCATDDSGDDVVLVKERVHLKDGTTRNNLKPFYNYERDFYITKERYQNHKQKKTYEDIHKLQKFTCTQRGLADAIATKTRRKRGTRLSVLCRNPYVYGADITTTSLIKHRYAEHWPNTVSDTTLAVLDFEADVVHGTDEFISGSLTFKDKAIIAYTKHFAQNCPDLKEKITEYVEVHLGQYTNPRGMKLEIVEVETPVDLVKLLISKAHQWQPDVIGIWNVTYDIPRMLDTLKRGGIDPKDVFSDPRLPEQFRWCRWRPRELKRGKGDGTSNKHPTELWHTLEHPAGFYFIDMMCLYCILRIAAGKRSSYKLDDVLRDELNLGKLGFDYVGIDEGTLEWHQEMQQHYKPEYMVYNIFDSLSIELLDEKNRDVSKTLRALVGISPIDKFSSNPRRLANDMHFYCLSDDKVMGTTSDNMEEDLDKYVLGKREWIVTLESFLRDRKAGLNIVKGAKQLPTDFYALVADFDVKSSYPTTEYVFNVSKETTHRELSRIQGLTEQQQRSIGINLSGGNVNAVELCNLVYDYPRMDQILDAYRKDKEQLTE